MTGPVAPILEREDSGLMMERVALLAIVMLLFPAGVRVWVQPPGLPSLVRVFATPA
jgi:hypothetical protein